MPTVEVSLPDETDSEIDRLIEQGEFLSREQAVEELLAMGITTHDTAGDPTAESHEEVFTQTLEDQEDPARLDEDADSEYTL